MSALPADVTELLQRLEQMLLNWSEVSKDGQNRLWREVHEQADVVREKFCE